MRTQPIITVAEDFPQETIEAIRSPLREYNHAQNPGFFAKWELPQHAARPLKIVARDAEGQVLGGLLGETKFSWLKIDILAISPDARRQGIGTLLMAAAETEALARGCIHVYVDTMSYQAPVFYEKLGYSLAGKLDDWDSHGHAKHLFVKRIG